MRLTRVNGNGGLTARAVGTAGVDRRDFLKAAGVGIGVASSFAPSLAREAAAQAPAPQPPKVKMPVLMFHGLNDTALNADGLSGTWNWLEKDLTLVTVPGAGHVVQQDASDLVTTTMRWWLTARTGQ